MKRIIFSVLVAFWGAVMVCAADYSGTCGPNLWWTFNEATGQLNIVGTGEMSGGGWTTDHSSKITSVSLPDGLLSIGPKAFQGCRNLPSITIPNTVTTIEANAFEACVSLESVGMSSAVETIGDKAFYNCYALKSLSFTKQLTHIGTSAFENCTALETVSMPNGVLEMYQNAFYNCNSMTSFTMGPGLQLINEYTFYKCSSLRSFTVPTTVTKIRHEAFSECYSLLSLNIPNSSTTLNGNPIFTGVPNVIFAGAAEGVSGYPTKWGAKSLNGYVDGYFVYGDPTKSILLACSAAAQGDITVPNTAIAIIAEAFRGCASISSITIPNSVLSIGDNVFRECESLESVQIPNSVTSMGNGVFWDCHNLDHIVIPNSVTALGPNYVFNKCTNLRYAIIGDGVPEIGSDFFAYCTNLDSIVLGSGVKEISLYMFDYNSYIRTLTCRAKEPPINETFRHTGYSNLKAIYVPCESVDAYKTSSGWSTKADIIQCAPEMPTQYWVQFVDMDGVVLKAGYVNEAEAAGAPSVPEHECLTFTGWDKDFSSVTSDLTINALYKPSGNCNDTTVVIYNWSTVVAEQIGTTFLGWGDGTIASVKIHKNTTSIYGIKLGYNYIYDSGRYFSIKPKEGGFKAGDELKIAVCYSNDATKTATVEIYAHDGKTLLYTTGAGINGRVDEADPVVETYTLTTDADSLLLGRRGNTGTYVVHLSVTRTATVVTPETPTEEEEGEIVQYHLLFTNGHDDSVIAREPITFKLPAAPKIEGFTFVGWQTVSSMVVDEIEIQAVYKLKDDVTSMPDEVFVPEKKGMKLLRNGQVYILHRGKTYTVIGQEVR